MSGFILIILLVTLAWFWLDSSRAKEFAVEICRQASEKYGVQFLDESVVLSNLGIRWPEQGLRFRRVYKFDFSRDGDERLSGQVALIGIELEFLDFDFSIIDVNTPRKVETKKVETDKIEPGKAKPGKTKSGTVIPIRKNSYLDIDSARDNHSDNDLN